MADDMWDWVEIDNVDCVKNTEKAGLFRFDDGEQVWIPWSLLEDGGSVDREGASGTLVIRRWKANEIGYEI